MSLFWSKTSSLVNLLSMMDAMGVNVVSSFNTPASAIFNRMGPISWCGMENGNSVQTGVASRLAIDIYTTQNV